LRESCIYDLMLGIGARVMRKRILVSSRHEAIAI